MIDGDIQAESGSGEAHFLYHSPFPPDRQTALVPDGSSVRWLGTDTQPPPPSPPSAKKSALSAPKLRDKDVTNKQMRKKLVNQQLIKQ